MDATNHRNLKDLERKPPASVPQTPPNEGDPPMAHGPSRKIGLNKRMPPEHIVGTSGGNRMQPVEKLLSKPKFGGTNGLATGANPSEKVGGFAPHLF